ncbi:conserved hypothetical protein [Aeropyrum pernix]|uniref:Metallo-beta-lactamase domain-containing protein n=1 Tax=Aeropyrum pernix TaxID=56636 RepID=A0A401H7J2_AERPX|nr:MBL fold metallo-hydrolase [Aeropyrum pernix]GBF08302.1 conserved hypothetical protein [Aeropyrum pernix]
MSLTTLAGDTLLLKGSPSTLFYKHDRTLFIVDPGHGRKRAKQISKAAEKLGGEAVVIVTHFHSDHLSTLYQGFQPSTALAPVKDLPMVQDRVMRLHYTFGYPFTGAEDYLLFKAEDVVNVEPLEAERVKPLRLVPLPGHTPGQTGVETPDGVLYAADSIFGERVLQTYAVPYHSNPCQALETLTRLHDMVNRLEVIVPSHGKPVKGEEAERLLEMNIERLEDAWTALTEELSRAPASVGLLASKLMKRYGAEATPTLAILVETAVRGYIGCHGAELEPILESGVVKWRVRKR